MAETRFTPGPWRLSKPDMFNDYAIQPPGEELAIAAVVNGEMRRMCGWEAEHRANAHLISSAPDLYEALMESERALESARHLIGRVDFAQEISDGNRAALAKAEGKA